MHPPCPLSRPPVPGMSYGYGDGTPQNLQQYPMSPMMQSPGSYCGSNMQLGMANQLLGMSPSVHGAPWDNPAMHQRHPHHHNTPNQQRRNPKHGKSVARSAPKPCTLSQQMAASGSYGSSGGGGGRPHMGIRGPHALGSPMEPGMRGPSPVRQPGPVYQELLRKGGGGGGAVSDLIFAELRLRVKIWFWVWVFGGAGAPPPPFLHEAWCWHVTAMPLAGC